MVRTRQKRRGRRSRRGQATVEYILLLSTIVGVYAMLVRGLANLQLTQKFMKKLSGDYSNLYQYGHPKAKAPENGGDNHPRYEGGSNSFRIFINPHS